MRIVHTLPLTALGLFVLGCGGEKKPAETPAAPPTETPAAAPTAGGNVVEVKMTGDGSTKAAFDPDHLTISPGTTVRFVNVSGWPHNVSFWPDSIPAGGADVLKAAMPNQMADLQGELMLTQDQTYEISFAGAPAGEYKGYCVPHLALGMRIWITVTP
jgi:plastocyanin